MILFAALGLPGGEVFGAAEIQPVGPADPATRAALTEILQHAAARGDAAQPFAVVVERVAQDPVLMQGRYLRAPLDRDPAHETLFASFVQFDCVTFVETVLAVADAVKARETRFEAFAQRLAALRYRHGEPAYCERLHYFTEWALKLAAAGRLEDVTAAVASGDGTNLAFAAMPHGLDFLGRHARELPALAGSAERQACIAALERRSPEWLARDDAATPGLAYIPTTRLEAVLPQLHGGDLVAWVAETPGLDVIHVSIVVRHGDAPPVLVHASQREGRVTDVADMLAYARSLPRQRGVIVLRPRDAAAESALALPPQGPAEYSPELGR